MNTTQGNSAFGTIVSQGGFMRSDAGDVPVLRSQRAAQQIVDSRRATVDSSELTVESTVDCELSAVARFFVLALSVAVTLGAQSAAPRPHRVSHLRFRTGPAGVPARCPAAPQLRGRRCDRGVPRGAASGPGFALAYWGEAMCFNQTLWFNENLEKARAALAGWRRLAPRDRRKAPTPREKGYLDAVERLFGDGDKTARNRAYADRMAELTRQFPDDDEAALFYALALLGTIPSGQRDPVTSQKAGSIATAILKKNPEHPGAAHYALHAFDDGEHAAMGLEAAHIYARIAPASSHARHMPSHVFLPLGMWDEAVASDESAFAASVARVKRLGLSMAQADFHS